LHISISSAGGQQEKQKRFQHLKLICRQAAMPRFNADTGRFGSMHNSLAVDNATLALVISARRSHPMAGGGDAVAAPGRVTASVVPVTCDDRTTLSGREYVPCPKFS
jgi:hypothetical protein